jgi:hypothetical protein
MNKASFLVILFSISAQAQFPIPSPTPSPSASKTTFDYNGMASTRYQFSEDAKLNIIQQSVVFGFTFSPGGKFDIVGVLQTADGYTKRFGTVINFNDQSKNNYTLTPHFKNLYLQKFIQLSADKKVQLQAGELNSNQKVGTTTFVGPNTAIGTSAWVEGARMSLISKHGTLSVTGGSMYDVTTADLIRRDRRLNYVEVQLSKDVFNQVALEASGGAVNGEAFMRFATQEQLKLIGEHVLTLVQEGFVNLKQGEGSSAFTASADLGEFVKADFKGRLNLDLRYAYNNVKTGIRGTSMNDLYLKGHIFSVGLYGKVNKKGTLGWFSGYDFGDQSRFQSGLNFKFRKNKTH